MEKDLKNNRVRLYAKILALVNSLVALPALGGTATSVLLFSMPSENLRESVYPAVFCLGVWLATIAGLTLLIGYWRRVLGKLNSAKSKILWKGTIVYNAVLIIFISIAFRLTFADAHQSSAFLVYLTINFLYCAAAISLSVLALRSDLP